MKTLVLGAGATGGYFGGRLAAAGRDITFLVRPERRQQIEKDGLIVKSPSGDLRLKVKTVSDTEVTPEYGVVLLTCKAYDLESAMNSIAPAMGPRTTVIPLINGLRHIGMLDDRFGPDRVLGGLSYVSVQLEPNGEIRHLGDAHAMVVGARMASQTPALRGIADDFRDAGFTFRISESIERELWEKFCFLATLASITCLFRGTIGDIAATRDGIEIMAETLDDCIAVARKRGAGIDESWRERTLVALIKEGSPLTSSMLRDVEVGARIEIEQIVGDMLRRADVVGVAAPWLRAAYCHLQTYENRRKREG
jgi:2-dehydropantoate 2-reductase